MFDKKKRFILAPLEVPRQTRLILKRHHRALLTGLAGFLLLVALLGVNYAIPAAEPASEKNLVAVIPIKGPIMDKGLPYFAKRAVELAKSDGAKLIIFEINTPGGAVSIGDEEYTMGIVKAIENCAPITSVAYIANAAISAGSLISVSCDQIMMQPDATIGAAEVIAGESSEPNPHQAKYTSAFENIFKAKAQKKGYPPNLFAAMVNRNLKVMEVKVDKKRDFLTEEEIKKAQAEGKDVVEIRRVGEPDTPLTLTATEAKEFGIATAIVNKIEEIPPLFHIQNAEFREMHPTWSESLVIFLTDPIVTSILVLIGLISIGMIFKMPGTGIPEIIAVICFALVFFGHYLVGLAALTDVLLFVAGIILLVVEVFIIPGIMVAGIAGIILILVSLVLSMQGFAWPSPEMPWQWQVFEYNIAVMLVTTVLALVIFMAIVRFIPYSPYLQRLILKTEESTSAGFTSAPEDYQRLIGATGTVLTYLRPSGKIQIGQELLDAVTEGDFIEKGAAVKVIQIEGSRIIVAKADAPKM